MSLEVPSCSLLCDWVAVLSCCTPAPRLLHELEACPSPRDVGTVYGLSPAMIACDELLQLSSTDFKGAR